MLHRIVRWTDHGVQHEADPRQAEKLLRYLKMDDGVQSAGTPGVKSTRGQLDAEEALPKESVSAYRAVVARPNYLPADRPDSKFAAKEVCRWMPAPTDLSLKAVKHFGRYCFS